jgi:hypothetical protein
MSCSPPTGVFFSWQAWDTAAATGAALLWCAPTQLQLPAVRVLEDGTYLTALIAPSIRGRRRERLLAAARAGLDLSDINTVPDAFDEPQAPVIHLARVIEYDVPDRAGNGTGERAFPAVAGSSGYTRPVAENRPVRSTGPRRHRSPARAPAAARASSC